jgi:hypothetical protein
MIYKRHKTIYEGHTGFRYFSVHRQTGYLFSLTDANGLCVYRRILSGNNVTAYRNDISYLHNAHL